MFLLSCGVIREELIRVKNDITKYGLNRQDAKIFRCELKGIFGRQQRDGGIAAVTPR
jgi:hypothetical protein